MSEKDPWGPKATVAIILALTVMSFPIGTIILRMYGAAVQSPETMKLVVDGYRDFIMVLIGALSGYIAGTTGKQD